MPPKTIRKAIANTLEDLSANDFAKFCNELVNRKEEPRVRRNRVEGKKSFEITDVLVSAFTESGAVDVTVELLRQMECDDEANDLVKVVGELTSKSGSTDTKETSGQTSEPGSSDNVHFVDKHKDELIKRVTNIAPILDNLLTQNVISEETYDEIRVLPTTQRKMRELYSRPLRAAAKCKDIFYQLLEEHEKYLIDDLKGNN